MVKWNERIKHYREEFGKDILTLYNTWVEENNYDTPICTSYYVMEDLTNRIERANTMNKASELLHELMEWQDWINLKGCRCCSDDSYFIASYIKSGIPYKYIGLDDSAIDYCLDDPTFIDWLDENYGSEIDE